MNRIARWAFVVVAAAIADQARSAENGIIALDNCFKASRLAYAICTHPGNSLQQRSDCMDKAQAAQLECLEHIPLASTGSATSADQPGAGASQGTATAPETAGASAQAPAQPAPPVVAPPETSAVAVAPAATAPPSAPDKAAAEPAKEPSQAAPPAVAAAPPVTPPVAVEPPRPAVVTLPTPPDRAPAAPARRPGSDWTISETTSPIDYSPVIVATMRSSGNGKDVPNALLLQCRQRRTEISLGTDGAWKAAPNNKVQVSLQTKDNTASSLWNLSANGKIATNTDNAVGLIQSLSEGGALTVTVSDGVEHAATFQLTGLDAIRKKISAACRSAAFATSKALLPRRESRRAVGGQGPAATATPQSP